MLNRSVPGIRSSVRPLVQQIARSTPAGTRCAAACAMRSLARLAGVSLNTNTHDIAGLKAFTPLHASNTTVECRRDASTTASSSASTSATSTNNPEMCVIVDDNNGVIGAATRHETVSKRLLGRGSYVLVFNSAGQLFVSKRSSKKDCYPGCLDVTISGVVNQGEEYADTAVRELEEEIGVPASQSRSLLQNLFIFPYKDDVCHVWGSALQLTWDGPVSFQDAEVEWGRFVDLEQLQQQLEQQPEKFTPVGRHILGLYFEHQNKQ